MSNSLITFGVLKESVTGNASALRCISEYQPAGGPGDKVFPATYEKGQYATEERFIRVADGKDGKESRVVPCVVIDSVQSQANRLELALLEAWERNVLSLPVITVDFRGYEMPKVLRITSLEAPHRIADALLRDSELEGVPFRKSEIGKRLDYVDNKNATALFELCPTALLLGMWDSTGDRGGLGAKFARAMVSEIVGYDAQPGKKTASRRDPAEVMLHAGPVYRTKEGGWTLDESAALKDKKGAPIKVGKEGKPSEINHGNVTPTIADGGFTISKAIQTTVISLPALRRLRFPIGEDYSARIDTAARTALAALGLCAAALAREQGADLRSRCHLVPTGPFVWELLDKPGAEPARFELSAARAIDLFNEAIADARKAGLPWMDKELVLKPSAQLAALVKKSQLLAASVVAEELGGE